VILVDSRAAGLHRMGHIPRAVSLPLLSPPESFQAFRQQHNPETPLVVYCGSDNCSLSQHLAVKLVKEYGFTNVQYIRGGYREWQQEQPVTQLATTISPDLQGTDPAADHTHPDESNLPSSQPTSWTKVKPRLENGEIVLIDARPRTTFDAGHIPGAVSLPSTAPAAAFEEFKNRYPSETTLVIYCGSQSCSLSKRLADRLIREFGFTAVEYMTGGYQEWQRAELQSKSGS
jgi:rhodanese-related sulfurtransferase